MTTVERSEMKPVKQQERVVALDVLRGFAILGILVVNVELFRGPEYLLSFAGAGDPSGADAALATLVAVFAESKFITTLAFLFGLGFALQGMRAEARGRSPGRLLARRMAALGLFGVVHAVLIWSGDILLTYALIGFLFLLFYRRRPRTLLVWAGAFISIPFLLTVVGALALLMTTAGGTEAAQSAPQMGSFREFAQSAQEAYTSGSYPQMVVQRLKEVAIFLSFVLVTVGPLVLAMMLIGGAVARAGWISDLAAHRPEIRRTALVGLSVGLPLNVVYALLSRSQDDAVALLAITPFVVGAPLLALGYIAAGTLLVERFPRAGATRRLAAVGRLALSNYLAQSIVMTAIFYGLGLYGSVGLAPALGIAAALISLQLLLSPIYLRRFNQGPAEWLWRRLTYGRSA
jgi:uncharacterized protein